MPIPKNPSPGLVPETDDQIDMSNFQPTTFRLGWIQQKSPESGRRTWFDLGGLSCAFDIGRCRHSQLNRFHMIQRHLLADSMWMKYLLTCV